MDSPNQITIGMVVETVGELEDTTGYIVPEGSLDQRRPGLWGMVKGFVPGHGGDVWWVEHPDGTVAPYCYTEFTAAPGAHP